MFFVSLLQSWRWSTYWFTQKPKDCGILASRRNQVTPHSLSECDFEIPKRHQGPAHIWGLPRWWKSLLLMYKIFNMRTCGLSRQITWPTTVKVAKKTAWKAWGCESCWTNHPYCRPWKILLKIYLFSMISCKLFSWCKFKDYLTVLAWY